jgi:phenylalanyl-tRNA synthetase beta chain
MSEREAIMRPAMLGSVLDAVAHNLARGATDVRLFESGRVYRLSETGGLPEEQHLLLGVLVGDGATALGAKAHLEAVLGTLRVPFRVEQTESPVLHPGKAGAVLSGDESIGLFGELHPLVARSWDVDGPAAAFELDLGRVAELAPVDLLYRDVTSFPVVRQDIAVVVAADVPAGRVADVVRAAGGELLEDATVFDRYGLAGERVSLALHLVFRAPDRTLTDEDVAPVRERIVAALAAEVGGELRG